MAQRASYYDAAADPMPELRLFC